MKRLLSFFVFLIIKYTAKLFYRFDINWVSTNQNFKDIRLGILLNHTSLYEPIFLATVPNKFLWELSRKMVVPAADKTLNRPFVGFFWKLLGPGIISISRKKDHTWAKFLKAVESKSIVLIAPEGRMKRRNGLDSKGRPMSVRSGVAEVIEELFDGYIIIGYSGGLHHVQAPGDKLPKLFKTIRINYEIINVLDYKKNFNSEGVQLRRDIVADLQLRMKSNCPRASF